MKKHKNISIFFLNQFFKNPASSCTQEWFRESSPKISANLVNPVLRYRGTRFFKLPTSKWYISGIFRPNVSKFVLCTIEKVYFDALKQGLKNNQMCAHSNP